MSEHDEVEHMRVGQLSDSELMNVVAQRSRNRHYMDALEQACQILSITPGHLFDAGVCFSESQWHKFLEAFVEAFRPSEHSMRVQRTSPMPPLPSMPKIDLTQEQREPNAGWPPQ